MNRQKTYKPKAKNELALKKYIKNANTKSKAGDRRGISNK
tara:strand:+ start:4449 stop:4568 length:120 start_codon:yes stop_codon:yes gene_type:complete